jgi:hypothetical protein
MLIFAAADTNWPEAFAIVGVSFAGALIFYVMARYM